MFDSFQVQLCVTSRDAGPDADRTPSYDRSIVSFSTPFKSDAAPAVPSLGTTQTCNNLAPMARSLSRREAEVLLWAAHGKSAWETAQLLGLREATVKFYVRKACVRLGVKNKTHAVAIALTHNLIEM
ncbi:helix-turn-helix transcriptional regulator [Marivita sp. GX14005]|uniref:helix-turn-helix domain-containing protein n=1 Tax=Marivita sp. GX14005 TaxID=2942276 RepID=UPI002019C10F|nr:helix-turn-helix transcriptional regulator [Marivita sp. GX14005]MCL3882677.1 helix-turn-helix transcriptional regulator [Marivita sp. GX14005]